MLSPKRTKYKKYHRGKMRGVIIVRINFFSFCYFTNKFLFHFLDKVCFGDFGFLHLSSGIAC